MSSFDFNGSSLGMGAEAFFTLEEDLAAGPSDPESVAEAEVKVSVDSGEDEQNDKAADAAATSAETVADAGAELFKDMQSLSALKTTLMQYPLHPSLYAYLNSNGQLDNLLQTSLPATESLSTTGDNIDLKDRLMTRLDDLFTNGFAGQKSLKSHIGRFFNLFCNKLQKMQAATDTVVIDRRARVGELIIRMEEDDTPESADVSISENADSDGDAPVDVPAEAESDDTVTAANTAEECNRLMKYIGIESLNNGSELLRQVESAASGDQYGFKSLTEFTRKAARELAQFKYNGRIKRNIHFSKYDVRTALENYYNMLNNWQNVNMLHYGIGQIAQQAKITPITGAESLNSIMPLFHTSMMLHNYLQTAKKAMDALYYNLQFAATKISKKRYR